MDQDRMPRLVSVIVPTYNHARYIGGALGSVLAQSHADLELIVVDNYSSDNTEGIVSSLRDPRIRYVKFANKGSVAASRNHGIGLARGEYVAFLDSDDQWLPDKLKLQLAVLDGSPEAAMTYSRYKTITGDRVSGRVLPEAGKCASGTIFRQLYLRHFIACSGVTVRKKVLDEAGVFDESPSMVAAEDTDLWLRIALRGPVLCSSDAPLFLYRIHAGNLSRGYWKKFKLDVMLAEKYRKKAGLAWFAAAVPLITLSVIKQKLKDMSGSAPQTES